MKIMILGFFLFGFTFSPETEHTIALIPYGEHLCLEVEINDQPCHVILDTGLAYSFLYQDQAKQLGCKKGSNSGISLHDFAGARSSLYSIKNLHIALDKRELPADKWHIISSKNPMPVQDNIRPVGLLGMDMLHHLQAKISYNTPPQLTITLP